MRRAKALIALVTLGLGLALALQPALMAQGPRKPLLMPNKKTIYQRVLTNPGAMWHSGAEGQPLSEIMPFTLLYVYSTKASAGGVTWLECAANTVGEKIGWIRGDQSTELKQALVLRFADRANRRPILFFRSYEALMDVANSPDVPGALSRLEKQYSQFESTGTPLSDDFPLIGVEATDAQGAVDAQAFYLMPIFTHDEASFENFKILEVASINPGAPQLAMWSEPLLAMGGSPLGLPAGYLTTPTVSALSAAALASMTAAPAPEALAAQVYQPPAPEVALAAARPEPPAPEVLVAAAQPYQPPTPPPTKRYAPPASKNDKFGIAILVDTTISMKPYMDQCRLISQALFDRLESEGLSERVYLGIVAYRSSVRARPGVEYVTRVISDLQPGTNRRQFYRNLERMEEARVSTHRFSEDALAGLETVVEELSWDNDFVARYVVMITDAGPLPVEDVYNSTRHTPYSMADLLEENGLDLLVFHIKSRAGRNNHAMAESAYLRIVSSSDRYLDIRTDYYDRGATSFGRATREVLDFLVDSIMATESFAGGAPAAYDDAMRSGPSTLVGTETGTTAGEVAPYRPQPGEKARGLEDMKFPTEVSPGPQPPPADPTKQAGGAATLVEPGQGAASDKPILPLVPQDATGQYDFAQAKTHQEPTGDELVDSVTAAGARVGASLGYSVALRYLGALKNTTAPSIVKSWIADKDLSRLAGSAQEVPSVIVSVLLTKHQLSTLTSQLKVMVETAEASLDTQSTDFFQSVLAASAAIAVDPGEFVNKPQATLAELGGISELLDGLPYKSLVMGLTERDWYNMSAYEQDSFIRTIKSLLRLYETYDASQDWAKFSETNEGDWLYRVPLTSLP